LNQPSLASGGSAGTLTAASISSNTGTATLNWNEVGIIDITAILSDYLGDAQADVATVAESVGRFRPDHFVVTSNNGAFDDACGSFSYIGQGFGYDAASLPSLDIVAKNQSASPSTTTNYTLGGFNKLSALGVTRVFPSEHSDPTEFGVDGVNLLSVTTTPDTGSLTVGSNAGELLYTFNAGDSYLYDKNTNAEVTPFGSDLRVNITSVLDADSVGATGLPVTVNPTSTELRYGRWNMENVYGPETGGLTMLAQTEYLNAAGNYILNTDDNCTDITGLVAVTDEDGATVTSPYSDVVGDSDFSFTAVLSSGNGGFSFSAAGSGNTGSSGITVDLTTLPWLQFDWDGDGDIEGHPGASATFGQYRGHDRIIYWREVTN